LTGRRSDHGRRALAGVGDDAGLREARPPSDLTALDIARCSDLAAALGARAGATAVAQDGFLLVEWPLPWPADAADVPELSGLAAQLADRRIRLQLVIGDAPPAGDLRVIWYRRCHPRPGYERIERAVPRERVADEAARLLASNPPPAPQPRAIDVLVCTNGRRDVCCGRSGTALFSDARRSGVDDRPWVRLWRTSHLGGHRFAPTTLVLPDGTMWAWADVALLAAIVDRAGHPADLLDRYRGTTTLARPLQALERLAFEELGWEWLDWSRFGEQDDEGQVRIVGWPDTGDGRAWAGRSVLDRTVPAPKCGKRPAEDPTTDAELTVVDVASVVVTRAQIEQELAAKR